ncbi:hypothetical protein [Kitasatospora cineracea]|uniref:Uncharacterized protein n=1 Tax=Kitasatospora cineracea TaxID=88074 RepID=A0A8G1UFG3_9ACTN|nr:hypothetical protein [Kitasatospora cineracea]ROR42973.1 hypothetical protein EDD39_1108 [Kitasatospora cineracea]
MLPTAARDVRLRLRRKTYAFREELHPRDGRGRFAEVPGAGLDPLLERIRAGAGQPSRAPRAELRFDEEQHGLVFRDGQSERVTQAYKSNVVDGLTDDLRNLPDEALLSGPDRVALGQVEAGALHAFEDPATGLVHMAEPGSTAAGSSARQIDADRARGLLRRDAVNRVVSTWAVTSNDEDAPALALQDAAREHFGLQPVADWPMVDQIAQQTAEHRADFGAGQQAMLTAMWNRTQTHLAEAQLGYLTVWRGIATPDGRPPAEWAADGDTLADPPMRPLSAFSLDPDIAYGFATAEGPGIVISGIVPAARVIATPATGLGCLDESEVVILAGPGTWRWETAE